MLNWNDVTRLANHGNPEPDSRVEKTAEEWKSLLTPEQFRIARLKGTERAGTGAFCHAHQAGHYRCVCCGTPLFDSAVKFDSATGWPSFTQPFKGNALKYREDNAYGMVRVEVLCNACDAHQGHVFPDGPLVGGLRYCINSESIDLVKKGV